MKNIEKKNQLYIVMLFIVGIIWGSGFIFTQIAIDNNYSTTFIMFVRFTLATIIVGFVFRKDIFPVKKENLVGGIISGISLFLGFMLQTLGLLDSSPSSNAFLTATNIVIVPFLTWYITKTMPEKKVFIGALLCFFGVWVLSMTNDGKIHFGQGEVLTLLGAICFAIHTTTISYFTKKTNPNRLNFLQLFVAAVLSTVVFLIADGDFSQLQPQISLLPVIYLAVFSTCIAYTLQTKAQKHVDASRVAVIISTESLFASVMSVALGYDNLKINLILGGILILLSVLIIEVDFKLLFQKEDYNI